MACVPGSNTNTTLLYQDGRKERVYLPVSYPVGTLLSVSRKNTGQIVAAVASNTKTGIASIISAIPTWSTGQNIRVKAVFAEFTQWMENTRGVSLTMAANAGSPSSTSAYIGSVSELGTIQTGDLEIAYNVTQAWVYIQAHAGAYVTVKNVQYSNDGGVSWSNVTDGDMSAGAFADDMSLGWVDSSDGGVTPVYDASNNQIYFENLPRYS